MKTYKPRSIFVVLQDGPERPEFLRTPHSMILWHVCKPVPIPGLNGYSESECGIIEWDIFSKMYRCSICNIKKSAELILSDGIGTGSEGIS